VPIRRTDRRRDEATAVPPSVQPARRAVALGRATEVLQNLSRGQRTRVVVRLSATADAVAFEGRLGAEGRAVRGLTALLLAVIIVRQAAAGAARSRRRVRTRVDDKGAARYVLRPKLMAVATAAIERVDEMATVAGFSHHCHCVCSGVGGVFEKEME
jgi:hypothetical protein